MSNSTDPISVLVAEDDPDDRVLADEILQQINFVDDVRFVADGQELLDYLRRDGRYHGAADWRRPNLVLLDLYMPQMDGLEALEEMQRDPDLASIPVVVLTGSESGSDIDQAHALGARGYMVKPLTFQRVVVTLESQQHEE